MGGVAAPPAPKAAFTVGRSSTTMVKTPSSVPSGRHSAAAATATTKRNGRELGCFVFDATPTVVLPLANNGVFVGDSLGGIHQLQYFSPR